jgi:hypothetical protein
LTPQVVLCGERTRAELRDQRQAFAEAVFEIEESLVRFEGVVQIAQMALVAICVKGLVGAVEDGRV